MGFIRKIREKTAVKAVMWASLPLFPLFCIFVVEYFNFCRYNGLESLLNYFRRSGGFPLAVLLMMLVFAALVLAVKRAWIACSLMGTLSLICALVNYLKTALNGDNFYPSDIAMIGSAGEVASFVTEPMPPAFWMALAALVIWVALYAVLKTEIPLSWKLRLPSAAAVAAALLILFAPSRAEGTLNAFGLHFEDANLQSSNYRANGFIGAFTLNILIPKMQAPEGYSEETIGSILAPYGVTDADGELYDVVVVLSESFFDVRTLPNVSFSENPLERYDEIIGRKNAYSGMMYSTANGGGTVRPEFEMITGLSTDYITSGSSPWDYLDRATETYVTNYKDAGYDAIAIHPYNEKFYSRIYSYGYAGFDHFYGQSELRDMFELDYKRGYVTDASTLEAMEYFLDSAEAPMFMFTITMQNHQSYDALPEEEIRISVSSDSLEPDVLDSVTTYTQGLYDADKMLGELCDYIDSRERPTILVFFGDHLPTLGSNHAAYNDTGFVDTGDDIDREEALKLFSTPFVIYANRDIDIDIFKSHTGNSISPYNMLNAVALATGFRRTPYMNLLLDFYDVAPIYNVRLLLDETEDIKRFAEYIKLITYDRTSGERYSVMAPPASP